MIEAGRGRELFERYEGRVLLLAPFAHLVGIAFAVGSGILSGANIKGEPGFGRTDWILLAVYVPFSMVVGTVWQTRITKRAWAWLLSDRQPTEVEQRASLATTWKLAAVSLVGWAGAAASWSVVTAFDHGAAYVVRVALSILLGGLATSGVAYMVAEWSTRPLVAEAFAYSVPDRTLAPGVRTRILLSWLVGSDVFLIMVALTFVGRPRSEPPSAAAVVFIVVAGLLAGTVVFFVTTRSLAGPLLRLRQALIRVQQGDLDVMVEVDDGSEIGLLQAGFNQMVSGLRERRTLQDLFGRHVGEDVAALALQRGVALGGERREVAAVFIDLINSTGLTAGRAPHDVVDLLNRFFSTVVRVISAEGGWVNKFEGDGALCVFGAPTATEGHATRALRAARTLRRELLALAAVHPELDAAIGVSAGPVVAGNVGAQQRYEYTVIGTPVIEAARLTEVAKTRLGRVLAAEGALAEAQGEAPLWVVADEIEVRGFSQPILVYEPAHAVRVAPTPG